jgi:hypothetical protein
MVERKEKTISLRVKKYIYDFLNDYIEDKPYDKTDVITKLIENFYMEFQKGTVSDKMMTTEMVFFAVDRKMKDFLDKMSKDCECSVRELVVNILMFFFMGYMTNSFQMNYDEMKRKLDEAKKNGLKEDTGTKV